jgi:hypothetical protein
LIANIAKIANIANINRGGAELQHGVRAEQGADAAARTLVMLAMLARLRWSTRIPADQLRRGLAEAPFDAYGAEADNLGNQ